MPDHRQYRPACEAIAALPQPWPQLILLALSGGSVVHTSKLPGITPQEVIRMRNDFGRELARALPTKS